MVECEQVRQGTSHLLLIHYADDEEGRSGQVQVELGCGKLYQLVARRQERKAILVKKLSAVERTAIVAGNGGLISNLKVWENLVLPARYHGIATLADLEEQARALFGQLGYDEAQLRGLCDQRPHELSLFEQKMVCFVRAMLMHPDLLVCDSLFDGLTLRDVERASRFSRLFFEQAPQRTFVHVCYDTSALAERSQSLAFYL